MRLFSVIIFITLCVFTAFSQTSLKTGMPAPMFTSQSIEGDFFDLETKRGSIVVLTFWATTCEICRNEIPRLNEFSTRFEGKNVIFLGLTMENETRVAPFLRKNPFKFTILPNSLGALLQYADRDRNGNLDMGFPAFFVIDQTGNISHRSSGYDKTTGVIAAIDRLISTKRSE